MKETSEVTDMESNNNNNQYNWSPPFILIPTENNETIDLMTIFCLEDNFVVPRSAGPDFPSTKLPISVYPPTKECWNTLSSKIIFGAEDHSNLVIKFTPNNKAQTNKYGEYSYSINCSR